MGPLPGSSVRCPPAGLVERQLCGPAGSGSGCAPALPDLSHPPQRPQAPNLPGSQAWPQPGHRGRTEARGFLLLPPAPRTEAVARETGLAVRGGSALSAPQASLLPSPRSPSVGGGAKGQRDSREPPNLPAGQGRDTGGTKTPGTTRVAAAAATGNASPEARPLLGNCHYPGYVPSLRSTDLSLPPRLTAIRLLLGSGSAPSPIVCALGSCASVVSAF